MIWHLLLCVLLSSLNVMANAVFHGKYHVVKKGSSKIIKCNTYTDEPQEGIEWRLNNIPKAHGNKHEVVMIDRPDAGNYTCYLNGKLLAYHYVLIDEPEEAKEQVKKDISCEANKFNGTFTCTWFREIKSSQFSASFYRKGSSGEMVSCKITDDAKCMNAICNDTTYSPYAEEFQPVIFILEAATKTRYESYSKTFSIRDILKPHPPKAIKAEEVNNKGKKVSVNVSWEYPDSWNKPHSYFPLLFKMYIEFQNSDAVLQDKPVALCSDVTTKLHKLKQNRISCQSEDRKVVFTVNKKEARKIKICVQAKEMYFESSWSEPNCTQVSFRGKRGKRHQRNRY